MKKMSKIMVFESTGSTLGPEVTVETETSRKSFRLPRSAKANEQAPLAIESFAQDPERYAELMERIEQYLLGFKDESSQE